MKKTLKVIALAMAALMTMSCFASCGSSEKKDSNGEATFKIGGIGPITDANAQYGLAVQHGAEIAVKEINDNGGVNGVKLEFKMEDDVADGEKAVTAYNSLKDWGMKALLGTVTTGACLAVTSKTATDNMFQITPSASNDKVITNDNVYQVCFNDSNMGKVSADYIKENKLGNKIAVIYDSSDEYSSGIYNAFKAEAKTVGLNIVSETSFVKDAKDFSVQISDAKSKGADFVFLPIYYNSASLILNQSKTAGYSPKFFGCDGMDGILSIDNFDASLAEGMYLLTPFNADSTDEKTANFVKTFKENNNGQVPNQFAADAYDGVYIIAELIKQGKVTADSSVEDVCKAFKTAISSADFSYSGLTGENLKWDSNGAVSKTPRVYVIKDGKYESLS